jgi:hypothetical protein
MWLSKIMVWICLFLGDLVAGLTLPKVSSSPNE